MLICDESATNMEGVESFVLDGGWMDGDLNQFDLNVWTRLCTWVTTVA